MITKNNISTSEQGYPPLISVQAGRSPFTPLALDARAIHWILKVDFCFQYTRLEQLDSSLQQLVDPSEQPQNSQVYTSDPAVRTTFV